MVFGTEESMMKLIGALRLIVGRRIVQGHRLAALLHGDGDRIAFLRDAVGIDEVAEGVAPVRHAVGERLAQRALRLVQHAGERRLDRAGAEALDDLLHAAAAHAEPLP